MCIQKGLLVWVMCFLTCIQHHSADFISFATIATGYEEKSPALQLHDSVSPLFGDFPPLRICLLTPLRDRGGSSILVPQIRKTRSTTMESNKQLKAAQSFHKKRIWILALEHSILSAEHKHHVFQELQKLHMECLEPDPLPLPVALFTWLVA